jgi:hypothetical protein
MNYCDGLLVYKLNWILIGHSFAVTLNTSLEDAYENLGRLTIVSCSLRYLEKKDSYNFMNAVDKDHRAVGRAHASSSGKNYCLVAFDQEAPSYLLCSPPKLLL